MSEAIVIVDLSFGDSGKGTLTDALVKRHNSKLVVRYNGGSQAAHNVVTDEGLHHTFSQLGSGMFNEGVRTLLGPEMLVDPLSLKIEAEIFSKKIEAPVLHRVSVSADCLVITPFHQALNRVRESLKGEGRHGSCGKGIGETHRAHEKYGEKGSIRFGQIGYKLWMKKQLTDIRDALAHDAVELFTDKTLSPEIQGHMDWFKWDIEDLVEEYYEMSKCVETLKEDEIKKLISSQTTPVLFEGAQGVLLDEHHGFAPYNTWTDTTTRPALRLIPQDMNTTVIGVIRTLTTRHGPGPFPTEDLELTRMFQDDHNPTNEWQREFRVGDFDIPLLRYAIECSGGVDELAVTHVDYLTKLGGKIPKEKSLKVCVRYELEGKDFKPTKFDYYTPANTPKVPSQQEQQTENMFLADMIYIDVAPEDMLNLIVAATGIPITITSNGPKRGDKQFV